MQIYIFSTICTFSYANNFFQTICMFFIFILNPYGFNIPGFQQAISKFFVITGQETPHWNPAAPKLPRKKCVLKFKGSPESSPELPSLQSAWTRQTEKLNQPLPMHRDGHGHFYHKVWSTRISFNEEQQAQGALTSIQRQSSPCTWTSPKDNQFAARFI